MQPWWAAPGCAGDLVDSRSLREVMLSIVGISDLSVRAATGEGRRLLADVAIRPDGTLAPVRVR